MSDASSTDNARRAFLKGLAFVVPATTMLGACAAGPSTSSRTAGPVYLKPSEKDFLDAATERLIPGDALGPGANAAGITHFIDLQLAGAYGRAERWYMQGPWPKGTEQQGFQLKYTPAQIYRDAIAEIDAHCREQYQQPFARLDAARQDQLLHALEDGSITLQKVPAKSFFALLWQNTQEGFLADPAYGGNQHFAGWKLVGFPGPRYNYVEEISQFGKRYTEPYVSLIGRDPKARAEGEV